MLRAFECYIVRIARSNIFIFHFSFAPGRYTHYMPQKALLQEILIHASIAKKYTE